MKHLQQIEADAADAAEAIRWYKERVQYYQRRVEPGGIYDQIAADADADVVEQLEELRALEHDRKEQAVQRIAELRGAQ